MKSQNQKGPNMKTTARYNLRFLLTLLLGGMLFAACEKDPVEKPQPSTPKVTTITFNVASYNIDLKKAKLDSLFAIYDTVYTTPEAGWARYGTQQITVLTQYLEGKHRTRTNKKGRGSFDFTPGVASVEDSIKLVIMADKNNAAMPHFLSPQQLQQRGACTAAGASPSRFVCLLDLIIL